MDDLVSRWKWIEWARVGLVFCASVFSMGEACAQAQKPAQGDSKAAEASPKERSSGQGRASGRGAAAPRGADGAAQARGGGGEPSAAYQESVRQTVERRRARRARRQQNAADSAGAVGAIVPWPMPPALIIRHTPEVHGDVSGLLYGLRR